MSKLAAQPEGTFDAVSRIRSNEVAVREIVIGKRAAPPGSPTMTFGPALRLKSPRGPIRLTSRSFSWYWSLSVDVRQFSVPRYWSASRTSAGVKFGRLAFKSATAPVTCGVAIDVPELYL